MLHIINGRHIMWPLKHVSSKSRTQCPKNWSRASDQMQTGKTDRPTLYEVGLLHIK